jgi:tRNA U34 5-carboxymethylaminomethyl modifying GTPase MnmE/TrmE
LGDNKEIRKLTKTPAWKVVKNQEQVLKYEEVALEQLLKTINLAKYSFIYPAQLDEVEKSITNFLQTLDLLRNGDKNSPGRQKAREIAKANYEEIRASVESIKSGTGFDLEKPETWQSTQ